MTCLWWPGCAAKRFGSPAKYMLHAMYMCHQEYLLSQIQVTSSSVTLLLMQACLYVQKSKSISKSCCCADRTEHNAVGLCRAGVKQRHKQRRSSCLARANLQSQVSYI